MKRRIIIFYLFYIFLLVITYFVFSETRLIIVFGIFAIISLLIIINYIMILIMFDLDALIKNKQEKSDYNTLKEK